MSDTDRIAEIRARHRAAVAGPWEPPENAEILEAIREDVQLLLDQLEQARTERAAAEEARLAWSVMATKRLTEVKAERDGLAAELKHERGLSRRLASEGTVMATAIQRVRDLHRKASHGTDCVYCTGLDRQSNYDCTWPCDTIRALAGEASDG